MSVQRALTMKLTRPEPSVLTYGPVYICSSSVESLLTTQQTLRFVFFEINESDAILGNLWEMIMVEIRPISPTQPIAAPGRVKKEENKPKERATKSQKKNAQPKQEKGDESLAHIDERA